MFHFIKLHESRAGKDLEAFVYVFAGTRRWQRSRKSWDQCRAQFANTTQRYVNIGTGVATKIADIVDMLLSQFPQLIIERGNTKEVEYSRADTTLLRQFWGGSFVRIEDYVRDHLISQIARQVG